MNLTSKVDREELHWLDEKFIKSMAKIHYLCMIERGYDSGYDIMQHMKGQFRLKLSAAAVYPVLQILESDGYITGVWIEGKHQNKKKYTLTPDGKKLLSAARKRIQGLARELTQRRSEDD